MADKSSDHHYGLAVSLSIEALKASFLLNGGAATALIALTDKSNRAADFSSAILAFGVGGFCAAGAFGFGYFSQLNYANYRQFCEYDNWPKATKLFKSHQIFQGIALALYVGSLIAGASGMWLAGQSIRMAKVISSEQLKGSARG